MNIFDKFILPHSGDSLDLIRYLLMLATVIYWLYGGLFFGSAFLSVFFNFASKKNKDENNIGLARFYADFLTGNKMIIFGLGIVPFLSIIIFFAELLKDTGSGVPIMLVISFILFAAGVYLIYSYKKSLHLSIMLNSIEDITNEKHHVNQIELQNIRVSSSKLSSKTGVWGIVLLFLSFWIYVAAYDLSVRSGDWATKESFITAMFSIGSLIKYIHFLCFSFSLIFAAFLLNNHYENQKSEAGDPEKSFKLNAWGVFILSFIQPLLFMLNLFVTPRQAISTAVFVIFLIAMIISFVLLHTFYSMIKEKKKGNIRFSFYLLLVVFALVIIKEQAAFGVVSEKHVFILADKYDKLEKEELEKAGLLTVKISGEDIYQTKCTACHKFNERLVGPPHKLIMLKYENNRQAMINFILNPVKVDPAYPAMPNQGLKANEAKAVVDYMFDHFGKELH